MKLFGMPTKLCAVLLFCMGLIVSGLLAWRIGEAGEAELRGKFKLPFDGDLAAVKDGLIEAAVTDFRIEFPGDVQRFRQESLGLLDEINKRGLDSAGLEHVRRAFNERHLSDVSSSSFRLLTASYVQEYLLGTLIPWMESTLANGVIADMRQIANTDNAVIVRDLDSGTEILRTQAGGLKDLRSFQVALGRKLRAEGKLNSRVKIALQEIMPLMVVPTLAVNQEVTNQRNEEMLAAVEPVFYKVQPGEVLVRAGDMVTHEQQIKLQALFRSSPGMVDWYVFGGCVMLGFFLLLGLFITPSGNKGTVLRTKDQNLIALLLVVFGLTMLYSASYGVSGLKYFRNQHK